MPSHLNDLSKLSGRIMIKIKIKSVFAALLLFASLSHYANAQSQDDSDVTWFEVEVILFKNTNNRGLLDEDWDKNISIPKAAENRIDFITDLAKKIEQNSVNQDDKNTSKKPIPPLSIHRHQDVNYQVLSGDMLQLGNEAKSIERNHLYDLVAHFGWRQPVNSPSEAIPVRIAGGHNFAGQYDYDGFQVLENATIVSMGDNMANENLKWVPEIDGEILIYLKRYLHVKADLYLRRADKEIIEALDMDQIERVVVADSDIDTSNQSEANTGKKEQSTLNDWSIDSDFLQTEAQTMYIDRLFNYPLKKSRKIRSGELHYFDHPMFGLFVIVRPYDITGKTSQD